MVVSAASRRACLVVTWLTLRVRIGTFRSAYQFRAQFAFCLQKQFQGNAAPCDSRTPSSPHRAPLGVGRARKRLSENGFRVCHRLRGAWIAQQQFAPVGSPDLSCKPKTAAALGPRPDPGHRADAFSSCRRGAPQLHLSVHLSLRCCHGCSAAACRRRRARAPPPRRRLPGHQDQGLCGAQARREGAGSTSLCTHTQQHRNTRQAGSPNPATPPLLTCTSLRCGSTSPGRWRPETLRSRCVVTTASADCSIAVASQQNAHMPPAMHATPAVPRPPRRRSRTTASATQTCTCRCGQGMSD